MEKLRSGLWRLNDAAGCTAYLVAGSDRAYMIDTGMGLAPLMPQIRAVTDLPVELLLTHAHPDHFAAAGEFEHVWLCKEDREILAGSEPLCRRFGVPPLDPQRVRFFQDGQIFDAGDVRLEALALPGHTPGSCAFGVPQRRYRADDPARRIAHICLSRFGGALRSAGKCLCRRRVARRALRPGGNAGDAGL